VAVIRKGKIGGKGRKVRNYIEKQIIIKKILFGRTERDCSIETGSYSLNIFHFLAFF